MASKLLQLVILTTLLGFLTAQECLLTQYRDASNLCQPCVGNCATCQAPNYCITCVANTFLVATTTNITCKPCTQVLYGCSICLTSLNCQTCQFGFILKSGKCESCSASVSNCSNCSSDGTTCNQCRYPYILDNNTCVSSTVAKILVGVQTVYMVVNNVTLAKVVLDNGSLLNASLTPNGCNQFQVYQNGSCIRLIYQCKAYQTNALCSVCHDGFIRTIYGDCEVKTYLLRCEDGFWKDAANEVCVKVDVSCDWYFPNNGSCFNCSSNYNMVSGICVPNTQCTSRQFFSAGQCVSVPLACLSFLSNGTCTSCSNGNTLTAGICTPSITVVRAWNDCVFPCSTCFYGQLTYCFSCRFGYQLKDHQYGSCEPLIY